MMYLIHEKDYQWLDIAEDMIPYLASNQYKEALHKYYDDANKDKTIQKHERDFALRLQ